MEVLVTFADGPGQYQLEVVNAHGNPLQMIFDRKVVSQGDTWVTWNGKNDQGQNVPIGQYFVIFYKDGKALRGISVFRSGIGQ